MNGQGTPTIKFKRSKFVYFFQVGTETDTITEKKGNLFYLVVPDSMKERIAVDVENGQLRLTDNDSIVKLNHVPGIRYESVFVKDPKTQTYEFKTLVNGASGQEGNIIHIKINDRKEEKVDMESAYIFKK
jgi:hypothetical protein